MKSTDLLLAASLIFTASCTTVTAKTDNTNPQPLKNVTDSNDSVEIKTVADATAIAAKKEVPVLCYHHIREARPGQSQTIKNYSVSPASFAEQMRALKDSGYQTILPGELYNYLAYGDKLPAKPVMLTFDDTDEEQFSIGAKEMDKYGFKGVYFIMTVSVNRPRYMTKDQLKQLSDNGHNIEAHTWDHHMVTKYQGEDWNKQLVTPRKTIEDITGKPATYFAYPFGLWNPAAIPELKKTGYKMAFILSSKKDTTEPLYTVRRMLVPGTWSTKGMFQAMKQTFRL